MRGDPSDAELVALTAVVAGLAGTGLAGTGLANTRAPEPATPRSAWADSAHRRRAASHPGPGAWCASGLPH
ncbi:MAG: acyl-CoA carboxylase subunit epsilon [Pseudonocardiaceae bacterium]